MKPSILLVCILILVLLIGAIVTPFAMIVIDFLIARFPAVQNISSFDIDRVMSRVLLISAFVLLFLFRRRLAITDIFKTAFPRRAGWQKEFWAGVGSGISVLLVLILYTLWVGLRKVHMAPFSFGVYGPALMRAVTSAIVVAIIEELFFRGFILKTFVHDMRTFRAVVLTSAFYSIVHFTQLDGHPYFPKGDLLAGFKTLKLMIEPLGSFGAILPEFIGLFLFGYVLAYCFVWTRALYLSIGLHAGCILVKKMDGLFTQVNQGWRYEFYGTDKMVDGSLSWIILGVLLLVLWLCFKKPSNA